VTTEHLERVRTGAAVAALVLAVLSRGDALVLAALLAVVAWRPAALAVVPALLASSWRWGSTSLEALAGAQAVLGPAGIVGPAVAATASWLAAAAILLSVPSHVGGMGRREAGAGAPNRLVGAAAAGAAAAAVVAGPAPGGDVWIRVAGTVVAAMLALGIAPLRRGHGRVSRTLDVAAVGAAAGALAAASRDAPAWAGTIDGQALGRGVALAVAAVAVVAVAGLTWAAMRQREA